MLNIRDLNKNDLTKLREIHTKYFIEEFEFPDFFTHFLCNFVVEMNGEILLAGGVRTILESVVITNKDFSARDRVIALGSIQRASVWTARHYGYREIHAFIQDMQWKKQLVNHGFHATKGDALVLEIG